MQKIILLNFLPKSFLLPTQIKLEKIYFFRHAILEEVEKKGVEGIPQIKDFIDEIRKNLDKPTTDLSKAQIWLGKNSSEGR